VAGPSFSRINQVQVIADKHVGPGVKRITAMAANLTVEQVAAIPFTFPTVTEAVGMAAQMICRDLGTGEFPQVWSTLAPAR
jgi:hypothetical protein